MTVFQQMLSSGFQLKVLNPIIESIPIDMVHDHSRGDETVMLFPNDDRSQLPYIRLNDLDPCSRIPSALMSDTNSDRAKRHGAARRLTCHLCPTIGVRLLPEVVTGRTAELDSQLSMEEVHAALDAGMSVHDRDLTMATDGIGTYSVGGRPFLGSGSTAEAAAAEGFRWTGAERHLPYWPLIEQRVARASKRAS